MVRRILRFIPFLRFRKFDYIIPLGYSKEITDNVIVLDHTLLSPRLPLPKIMCLQRAASKAKAAFIDLF